jgi:hypothetical protein
MGCWNKTCGLSNLPIYYGEEVYVFLIQENAFSSNHCYSDHLYSPIIAPFYSQYDDHGTGENSSGVALPVIINSLKNKVIEKELGKNEYHDLEVKRDNLTVDTLFEFMRKRRLSIGNPYKNINTSQPDEVKVEFVMLKKDIVDDILEKYAPEMYWKNSFVEVKFSDICDEVYDVIEAVIEVGDEAEETIRLFMETPFDIEDKKSQEIFRAFSKLNLTSHGKKMVISPYAVESILEKANLKTGAFIPTIAEYGMSHFSSIVRFWPEFANMVSGRNLISAKEFFIDSFKGIFISSFFECTRRSWIPQSGEGSQSTNLDEHRMLANAIIKSTYKQEEE